MDYYIDIGAAVMLRMLREAKPDNKFRKVFLKLYRAISIAFSGDEEFRLVSAEQLERDL